MEQFTDKNKEHFEKWFYTYDNINMIDVLKNSTIFITVSEFSNLPFEMQIGVIQAYYFDLKKILMNIHETEDGTYYCKTRREGLLLLTEDFKNPIDAQKQWVGDMNELMNGEYIKEL